MKSFIRMLGFGAVGLLFSACSGSAKGSENFEIWAHRGCSYAWPENTIQSFRAAAELPVTGIELDIQLTKDNKIVVIHDETVDRTTDGSGNVQDFTLAELKALKIQTHPELEPAYTEIPTMEEVLNLLKPYCLSKGLRINIELKTSRVRYEGIEDMILALVHDYGLEDYIVYSSFNPDSIMLIKEKLPSAQVAILNGSLLACMDFARDGHNIDGLHPHIKQLNVADIRAKTSLPVRAWGSAEPFYPDAGKYEKQKPRKLQKLGVTGIFTNVPEFYCK